MVQVVADTQESVDNTTASGNITTTAASTTGEVQQQQEQEQQVEVDASSARGLRDTESPRTRTCSQLFLNNLCSAYKMDDEHQPLEAGNTYNTMQQQPADDGAAPADDNPVAGGDGTGWYKKIIRPLLGELVGTTLFIYMLCMTSGMPDVAAIGAGFTLFIIINLVGHISGAHVNPAVTLGALLAGEITPMLSGLYFLTQLIASMISAALYRASVPEAVYNNTHGANTIISNFKIFKKVEGRIEGNYRATTPSEGILIELIMTSILVLAVQVTALDRVTKNPLASLVIGLTISACATIGGPYTGCSLNPARSFGPAAVWSMGGFGKDSDVWSAHYVYWVGPLVGAVLAAVIYRLLLAEAPEKNILQSLIKRKKGI